MCKKSIPFVLAILLAQNLLAVPFDSAEFYLRKAQSYSFVSNDSMQLQAQKARAYSKRSGDYRGEIAYFNIIGVSNEQQGNYELASMMYDSAMLLATSKNDSSSMSRIYNQQGVIKKELGDYINAVELFIKSKKLAERFKLKEIQAISSINLALVYGRTSKLKEAYAEANSAISISRDDKSLQRTYAGALIEKGNILTVWGKLDSALIVLEEALVVYNNNGISDGKTVVINNIGAIYYYTGKHDIAIGYFKQTYDLAASTNDQINMALANMNIGDTYRAKKAYKLGQEYLERSIKQFKVLKHKHFLRDAYECLANLEKDQGHLEQALANTYTMYAYKDSILNENSLNKISELQVQYETEKKDAEIKILLTETELKQAQLMQTRIIATSVLVVVVLILLAIVFYNRQRRLKMKAEMALEKELLQKERFRVVIDTEEKERKRVARELHDGLGQMLSTVRLFVSDMGDANDESKIERSLKALDTTIDEVRTISHNMMPIKLLEMGLSEALIDMVKNINASGKLTMNASGLELLHFNEGESIAIYRTIQEVVNNAIKYAKANHLEIGVSEASDELIISVKDDGQGFNTEMIAKSKGIGWSNIYARMELIGASVQVKSMINAGTTVTLHVPLNLSVIRTAG